MFPRITCIAVLLSALFGYQPAVLAISQPDEIVKNTAHNVVERIKHERAALEADPDRLHAIINEEIVHDFDFASMSKFILGGNWKTATDTQRIEFMEQFKTLLVNTYAKALLGYSDQAIRVYPVEYGNRPNLAMVRTELIIPGPSAKPFPIAYRMYKKNDQWKIIDITVDGVSLVATYRNSFAVHIKKEGFDSLLQSLADKNSKLENDLKAGS